MKRIRIRGSGIALVMSFGCSQTVEEKAPGDVTQSSPAAVVARQSAIQTGSNARADLAARVQTRAEGAALLRTPQYELARAHSAEAQVTFREELSTRLPLSAAEREQFLGILAEHDAARLQFMDFIRSTRGLSREERQERLKNNDGISKQASEKSKPAWLSARISSVLGPARLAQYQEAISTRDTWRHN